MHTDDIEGLIDAIIKANQNLTESSNNKDWEMMGSDIQRLQDLIKSLETAKEEEDKKQEKLESMQGNTTGNTNTSAEQTNIVNGESSNSNSNQNENKQNESKQNENVENTDINE